MIVHSMDRLARNLDDLRRLVRGLTDKGVRVQFITENLTFTGDDTAMATLLLSVMGAFAEFERALSRERQREGIAKARLRGAYRGRKRSLRPVRSPNSAAGPPQESRRRCWPKTSVSAARRCTSICDTTPPLADHVPGVRGRWRPRPEEYQSRSSEEAAAPKRRVGRYASYQLSQRAREARMSFPTPRRQSSGRLLPLPEVSTSRPPNLSHTRVQLDMRWTF